MPPVAPLPIASSQIAASSASIAAGHLVAKSAPPLNNSKENFEISSFDDQVKTLAAQNAARADGGNAFYVIGENLRALWDKFFGKENPSEINTAAEIPESSTSDEIIDTNTIDSKILAEKKIANANAADLMQNPENIFNISNAKLKTIIKKTDNAELKKANQEANNIVDKINAANIAIGKRALDSEYTTTTTPKGEIVTTSTTTTPTTTTTTTTITPPTTKATTTPVITTTTTTTPAATTTTISLTLGNTTTEASATTDSTTSTTILTTPATTTLGTVQDEANKSSSADLRPLGALAVVGVGALAFALYKIIGARTNQVAPAPSPTAPRHAGNLVGGAQRQVEGAQRA